MAVIAPAYTAPLTRKPLRFGVLSVAEVVDDNDPHWQYGGVQADADACVLPGAAVDPCATQVAKDLVNAYEFFQADPFSGYILNACRTVGRLSDAEERTRRAYATAEEAAVAQGFATAVLGQATALTEATTSLAEAFGLAEETIASEYGSEGIIWVPRGVAGFLSYQGAIRVGDRIETIAGTPIGLVAGLAPNEPTIWATGAVRLLRGPLNLIGPVVNTTTNEFIVLAERTYAAFVDCLNISIETNYKGCPCEDTP